MTKSLKVGRILASAGALAMIAAPVAGVAGTRAADAGAVAVEPVKLSTVSRASAAAKKESEIGGSSVIIAVLAAAAVIAGIIVATDDDNDDDVSPGA